MILDILITCLLVFSKVCHGDTGNYKHYRLESLCKSDSGKTRLRLGNTAATFKLNSSLIPGHMFNCHLELALDSSKLGFFVYFEDLNLSPSTDCEDDYIQFGRDILFITSFRSDKFCDKIQGSFPSMQNRTAAIKLPKSVTPLSQRTYLETTDQEMDVWIKLKLNSPSLSSIKTVSFIATPVLRNCGGQDVGYRRCSGGSGGYCVREQFFCDGHVNCHHKHAVFPPDETDCKTSSTSLTDLDKADWQDNKLYYLAGPAIGLIVIILFVMIVYHKFPSVLNLPVTSGVLSAKYSPASGATPTATPSTHPSHRRTQHSDQYQYHTGHIVPVARPAPPPPTSATAPPLPRCPPPYSEWTSSSSRSTSTTQNALFVGNSTFSIQELMITCFYINSECRLLVKFLLNLIVEDLIRSHWE